MAPSPETLKDLLEEIAITPAHDVGLYDSDTGDSLKPIKVIDATMDGQRRTLLLYTEAKRGRIVQVTQPYDGQEYMGVHIHYFFDEPTGARMIIDDGWRSGMDGGDLLTMIMQNAPPPSSLSTP